MNYRFIKHDTLVTQYATYVIENACVYIKLNDSYTFHCEKYAFHNNRSTVLQLRCNVMV